MNAQALVQTQQQGPVLVVSINNPPVNALGQGVRAGLLAAVEQLEQDAALKAMLIVGQGKAKYLGAEHGAAAVAAMAGLALSLFVPRRRLWVRTTTGRDGGTVLEVAGLARGDDPRLQPTVDTLATRLTPSPAPLRGGSDDPVP